MKFAPIKYMAVIGAAIFIFCSGNGEYRPQSGDLIFQESASGEFESSIKEVTTSADGFDFTHVGIVYIDRDDKVFVLEAKPPTVCLTPLDEFLHPAGNEDVCDTEDGKNEKQEYWKKAAVNSDEDRGASVRQAVGDISGNEKTSKASMVVKTGRNDKTECSPERHAPYPVSVVARLKPQYRHLIDSALAEGLRLLGRDYDHAFILGDEKYYCSELIYDIFKKAAGQELFPLNTMTFKSPGSDGITDGWKTHFDRLGIPVPEGEPGINPGAMSRSDVIEIIHVYK